MVEGNIHAVGMLTFQLPPSGQNIPADGQMLWSDFLIYNLID